MRYSPGSATELLERCRLIEGKSLAQLASMLGRAIPEMSLQRKGWAGGAIESILGATAGTTSAPDFHQLGIELKTIPLNHRGMPCESTFITSINLLTIHKQSWKTSTCFSKLRSVLWVPIEGDKAIAFAHRRIGRALLWSPNALDEDILEQDWLLLTEMLNTGKLDEIDAGIGQYLQIRPKAANARSVCYGFDNDGNKVLTLPRGFYLRSAFTATIPFFGKM